MSSPKVCIVEAGEVVRIVEAIPGDIPGKYRVRVVAAQSSSTEGAIVDLRTRDRDYSLLPYGASVSGWGSWKTSTGSQLFVPRDLADAATSPMRHWLGKYV